MFVDYVSSRVIAAGVVPWPVASAAQGSGGRTTLIAKLELARSPSGDFRLVDTPESMLNLDRVDGAGELLFPTDFAPYKPQCDVLVIGAAIAHRGPGRLAIGPSARAVEAGEGLGPRQSFCPEGDPLDGTVADLWATGGIDFVRFQAAPPDRRIAWPGPFELEYTRGALRVAGRVTGPFPRAFVLSSDGVRLLGRVPMLLDTIALEPDRDRVVLVFRAIYDRTYPANVPERLAFDLEPNAVFDLTTVRRWHAARLSDPRTARQQAAKSAEPEDAPTSSMRFETQTMQTSPAASTETRIITHPVSLGPAIPFQRPAPSPSPAAPASSVFADKEETGAVSRSKSATLPFQRTSSARAPVPLTSSDLGALRAQGERPVTGSFASESTAFARAPGPPSQPAAPVALPPIVPPAPYSPVGQPFPAPPPMGSSASAAPPQGTIGQGFSLSGAAAPQMPASPNVAPPPPSTTTGQVGGSGNAATAPQPSGAAADEERVNRILKEIWKGDRSLPQILEEHGLTEVEWRVLRRKASKPR